MGGAIIGLNSSSAHRPAPATDLEALYNDLAAHLGRYVVINGYGEALGPSQARPWTLTGTGSVTEFIQANGVFVDYCGWPLSYLVNTDGGVLNPGPNGFRTVAKALGYDWLGDASFQATQDASGPDGYSYPFGRGYSESGSVNGLYLPHGSFTANSGKWTLNGSGFAAMLGVHRPGIGWYFYGTSYSSTIENIFGAVGNPTTVPVAVYSAFIKAVVQGRSQVSTSSFDLIISHEPYTVAATPKQKNTTGPSSPYGGSSSSGSSSTGSSGSSTGTSTKKSTTTKSTAPVTVHCPTGYTAVNGVCVKTASTVPSWLVPVGLGAAGIAGIGYAGYVEGWWGSRARPSQTDD